MDCNEPVELQDFDILLHEKDGEMIRKMEIAGVSHLSLADEAVISACHPQPQYQQ